MDNPETPTTPAPEEPVVPTEPVETPSEEVPAEAPAEVIEKSAKPEETPAEPETSSEPATPAEPAAEPVSPVAPAATSTEPAPKKKMSRGLKIGLISAGAALVIGGGGFAAAYAITNQPENVALSALSNLLKSEQAQVSGTFRLTTSDSALSEIKLILDTKIDKESEVETAAHLKVAFDDDEIEISLGMVMVKDGTVYIQLNDLKDAIDLIKDSISLKGIESEDVRDQVENMIDDIVGKIDGKWWKISVDDLMDQMIDEADMDKEEADEVKNTYSCLVDTMQNQDNNKYADIYRDNAFITLEGYNGKAAKEIGSRGKLYSVSIDNKKLESFITTSYKEGIGDGIAKCLDSFDVEANASDIDDIDLSDFKLPENTIVSIDGLFSHKLTGVYMEKTVDDNTFEATVKIGYEDKDVAAPADFKNITDLFEDIYTVFLIGVKNIYNVGGYVDEDYASSSQVEVCTDDECIDELDF